MRRRSFGATAAAVAFTIISPLVATPAGADVAIDTRHTRFRDFAEAVQALDLSCALRAGTEPPAIVCEWTPPSSSLAVGIRLLRLDPDVDPHRMVVFRTDDITATRFLDRDVRAGHHYGYVVLAVDRSDRVVGRSRARWVRVPPPPKAIDAMRLHCALGPGGASIGCEWSSPTSDDVAVVSLWRAVDGGPRELVERFQPSGPTSYRDSVPREAHAITYSVVATSDSGEIVAQSRPDVVRVPIREVPTVVARPVETRPTDTTRPDPVVTRTVETSVRGRTAP